MNTEQILTAESFLKSLEIEMEGIMGQWNGDESGMLEENASVARDIKEKSEGLRALLTELDESF